MQEWNPLLAAAKPAPEIWACGVCELEMQEKTPGIVCKTCLQWVHLRKCAGITVKEASKLDKSKKKSFKCSRCVKTEKAQKKRKK